MVRNYTVKYWFLLSVFFLVFCSLINPRATLSQVIWQSEPDLPISVSNNHLFRYQNTLFSVAGSSTYVTDKTFKSFISDTGVLREWEEIFPFPKKLFWYSEVQNNNVFYVIGGTEYPSSTVVSTPSVYYLDLLNSNGGVWIQTASLPLALGKGASEVIQDTIYFSGGGIWNSGGFIISSKIYKTKINDSGSLEPWVEAGELPYPMLAHKLFFTGNKLYLIGGHRDDIDGADGNVYLANFDLNGNISGWIVQNNLKLPIPTSDFMMVNVGEYLIVAGGRGPTWGSSTVYDNIYYSKIDGNGELGNWIESSVKLPRPLCCAGFSANEQRIYLTGGHDGGSYFSNVWSIGIDAVIDGYPTPTITPTPSPTPTPTPSPTPTPVNLKPVVFLPGMGASWNHDAIVEKVNVPNQGWTLAPYARDTYRGLFLALESAGYIKDDNFFIYNYDWRQDVRLNAVALQDFINTRILSRNPPGTQVDLVGHSMGGYISRLADRGHFADKIDKVIALGTPYNGSGVAYKAWEGAEFSGFTGILRIAINTAVGVVGHLYQSPVSYIQSNIPSFQNILPGWNYLKGPSGELKDNAKLVWQNNLIEEMSGNIPDKLGTIGGLGHNTIKYITVGKRTPNDISMGRWVDGRPLITEFGDGDDATLIESLQVPGSWKHTSLSSTDHGELCSKESGQMTVLQYLGVSGDGVTVYPKPFNKAVIVTVGSPVVFSLILPDNTQVFPEDNIITLDNPQTGQYRVKTVNTGLGKAKVYFGRISDNSSTWTIDEFQATSIGQEIIHKYYANLNVPHLGTDPLNEAQMYLNKINLQSVYPPVTPFISKINRLMTEFRKVKGKDQQRIGEQILITADQAIRKSNVFYQDGDQTIAWLRLIKIRIDQYLSQLSAE